MIRKSLYWKITLAFVLVAFISAGLVTLVIRASSPDRLTRLILDQQQSALEKVLLSYYSERGSWQGIDQNWWRLQFRVVPTPGAQTPQPPGNATERPLPEFERERRSLFGLADAGGTVIVSVDPNYPPGSQIPQALLQQSGVPLTLDGQTIGFLLRANRRPEFDPAETLFLRRTYQALGFALGGALLVAILMGFWLARRFTRPLQALTEAAKRIAHGDLEQEVPIKSGDEIGQLAEAFNHMSREVARANQMRRQMTADIAHDLRTPLTVIAGYIESMREGVLAPTQERFSLIYSEIERLQRMVEDLRVLSQADAGELPLNLQDLPAENLLTRAVAVFQHRAQQQGVNLRIAFDEGLPPVRADESRIMQVMDNLLNNALRYTRAGGEIVLEARAATDGVEFLVRDNGEGIPAEDLPRIFERFYRGDKSRHSEAGEMGLGLAIVKAIIEAHGGQVWANSSVGGGTEIHFKLPAAETL